MRTALLLAAMLALATPATPASVHITVDDFSGAPLKDELVIVEDLNNHGKDVLRALTDQRGQIPTFELPAGLYRAIATAPYGLWETEIREFLVGNRSIDLVLKVDVLPTHGNGDIVTIGIPKAELRVLTSSGQRAAGAWVLIRDSKATLHLERWYTTDKKGEAEIELVGNPTVVVVVYGDLLATTSLSSSNSYAEIRLPPPE